ncbi:uncharacterized protein IUM83_15634 [Phytophthora cinnamomi]|uniref:uncharacterized protein n=1 Tax=Phytophthora cinnamomi TaxID=4785 RepID=UPI00355A6B3D|nr:hypothetical protein IUM83_15634 [Phytophthora cinnamomi]
MVLDGWSNSERHYVAIFAVFDSESKSGTNTGTNSSDYYDDLKCPSRRFLLLAFCPVEDEEDLSAQILFDLIADTLMRYRKPWETVKFMVGDNCAVNQCIGRREGAIPLVSCASHRFNLVVQDFLKSEDKLIGKIQALMTKFRTIKGRALLRRVSSLAPLLLNDTRWSSTYAMVKRYLHLEPAISQLGHGVLVDYDWQPLLLRRAEHERARGLLKDLTAFEGVTKALQKTTLTLSAVRRLFDQVVKKYPAMKARLAVNAAIVNYPNLESGLVKLQRGEALTAAEKVVCSQFGLRGSNKAGETVEEQGDSIAKEAFKRRKVAKRAAYEDIAYVPPTSSECERFFSSVKLVYTDLRKRLEPATLEKVICLLYNKELWDVQVVDDVRRSNAN